MARINKMLILLLSIVFVAKVVLTNQTSKDFNYYQVKPGFFYITGNNKKPAFL